MAGKGGPWSPLGSKYKPDCQESGQWSSGQIRMTLPTELRCRGSWRGRSTPWALDVSRQALWV